MTKGIATFKLLTIFRSEELTHLRDLDKVNPEYNQMLPILRSSQNISL